MTRRQVAMVLASLVTLVRASAARAQVTKTTTEGIATLRYDLATYDRYEFLFNDDVVSLTPGQIHDALVELEQQKD